MIGSLGLGDGLIEVGDDVIHVLDADGEADEVLRQVGILELLGGKLRVRGRGRMDNQGLCVADIGQMRKELDVVHDVETSLATTLDAKDQSTAERIVMEELLGRLVGGVILQSGVADPGDLGVLLEELGNCQGVVGVALDAQGQVLQANADELSRVGREGGTEVAKLVGQDAGGERRGRSGVGKDQTVVGGVGLCQGCPLLGVLLPVELAGVDYRAAQGVAVAVNPLGRRRRPGGRCRA